VRSDSLFISLANGVNSFSTIILLSQYCKVNDFSKNCNRQNVLLKIKLISTWRIPMSISQISVIGIQKKRRRSGKNVALLSGKL
jgi:hypothetical protein